MPPRKRPSAAQSISDDESEEDVKPKVKRQSIAAKPEPEAEASNSGSGSGETMQKNDQGDEYLKLSETRRLTVRSYNKKTLVDLREYYKDKTTGELKPGAKGISLTNEQWTMLKESIPLIDAAVAKLEK